MTMWDFFHAHAEGLGAMIMLCIVFVFLIWFMKEVNK